MAQLPCMTLMLGSQLIILKIKIQWNLDLEMKKNQSPYKYNLRRNITFQNNVTVYNIQLFTLFLFLFFALKSIHNFWTIWSTYSQVTIYSTTLAYVTRFWIRSKQWLSCIYYVVERKKNIYIYMYFESAQFYLFLFVLCCFETMFRNCIFSMQIF